jgi:flagellar biosynthesis GTPase FlhF
MATKVCKKCGDQVDILEFRVTKKGYVVGSCKSCEALYKKAWYAENKDMVSQAGAERYNANRERIITRSAAYYVSNRDEILKKKSKYNKDHSKEISVKRAAYYVKHKEAMNARSRLYYKNNRIRLSALNKEYAQLHKDGRRVYLARKMKTDINYKISCNLRTRLSRAMVNGQKTGSAVADLGCSIIEFKAHLETMFYNNIVTGEAMTWHNYGLYGWHIDHVIPLSSFNLKDEMQFLSANHYTNLQPLWAKDNLIKSDKTDCEV